MANDKWKMKNRILMLSVAAFTILCIPHTASAAVSMFAEGPASASVGSLIPITLNMRVTESVNAVKTTVSVLPATVRIERFDDSASAIRLWLQKPNDVTSGSFELQGVIPGGIGPGFTDVVPLGTVWLRVVEATTIQVAFSGTEVYLNQPQPTLDDISSTLFSVMINDGEAQEVPTADVVLTDTDVRIVREPALYDGARSIIFDVKTNTGTVDVVRIRERWLGVYGAWRDAESPSTLSDSWGLSILDVSLPASLGGAHVATVVPSLLKILWGAIVVVVALLIRRMYTKRH